MSGADVRRPFVLIGLGYGAFCVGAVWADHAYRMWRHRRRVRHQATPPETQDSKDS